MKNKIILLFILIISTNIIGCSPASILVSGAGTGMVVAEGDRSFGTVVDDATIKVNIAAKFINSEDNLFIDVSTRILEGRVLLTGLVDNQEIRIDLTSKDVIHNFKLPELRVSQDAIPGMSIPVHFKATSTSEEFLKTTIGTKREGKSLEIACAQLCGLGHYRMKGYLTISEETDYLAWLDEQAEYLEEESGGDDDWGDDDW